jgi:protein-L-isoaspartate(D-aspartate) O-methyltransferase
MRRISTPDVRPRRDASGGTSRTAVAGLALVLALALAAALPAAAQDGYAEARAAMVEQQVRARGISDPAVLAAMERVPRHLFVPETSLAEAYEDKPLPIGYSQTISQPYVVALMTELLDLDDDDKVLEIGTGSGYHTAVLSRVAGSVYSIEIIEPMALEAARRLARLGYDNVHLEVGDGYKGWPEMAPFDAIILTAAPPRIPQPLLDQLKVGGKMVAPVGGFIQDLQVITKAEDGIEKRTVIPVRLVPMTGQVREGG